MTTPTIRLATDDDMRAITSQNLHLIRCLPCLYIATDQPDVMRSWGVALERTFRDFERLYPGALVAPHYDGQAGSRGDLLYHGAEPATAFNPQ